MEQLLEAIRAAVAPDATDEVKTAGATACRSILATLEPPSSPTGTARSDAPAIDPNIAALAMAIRGMPMDQLLDLAIAKLRTMVPPQAAPTDVRPLTIPLIPVVRR